MIDDAEDRQLQQMVRDALRSDVLSELDRDLWPRMQARLAAPRPSVSWVDLLLLAAIVILAVAFPDVMLNMLYHL